MKVTAKIKYLRISPRKVRLVADLVKGMDVEEAKIRLQLLIKRAAKPLLKLLNSAVAAAKHNFDLEEKNLYIYKIVTNQGPTLKRWRARARGVAAPIMKRSSHVILELAEKVISQKKTPTIQKATKPTIEKVLEVPQKAVETKTTKGLKTQIKKKPKKKEFINKKRLAQIGKKIFRRKSI